MNEKLKKLEIKKLFQEYNYLIIDDEYKQEIISENKIEFLNKVKELETNIGIKPENKINSQTENGENINLPEKPKLNSEEVSKSTKDKVKKIYREIVKKTHPDKTDSEDLIDLYMKATEASEIYNLFELFIICDKLDIEIDLDFEDKETLLILIEMKKKELKSIESSFIWLYANSKSEEEKNKIIEIFVNKHGTKK